MFAIEMLPAREGDCLWIEYGPAEAPYRILIDGGTIAAAPEIRKRIEQILPPEKRRFELAIVTHVDSDHIAGMLKLLQDPPPGLFIKEAWFNAYPQLAPGMLGPKEGEFLAVHFNREEQRRSGYWNGTFGGRAVGASDHGELRSFTFEGGLQIVVLAPGERALMNLRKNWEKAVTEYFPPGDVEEAEDALKKDRRYRPGYLGGIDVEKLADAEFEEDTAPANASSVVVLTEYEGHRCLFTADTLPSTLVSALKRLPGDGGSRVKLSLVKVPHHGSMNNNSSSLYRMIDCPRFLISTNGAHHGHPHPEGIARILTNKCAHADLYFNYHSTFNEMWLDEKARRDFTYTPHFPDAGQSGIRIDL